MSKTFFFYYIEEFRVRIFYYLWSFFLTWILCSFYTYESLYLFLIPYARRFIFTESGELFFQIFFFHGWIAFFWNFPYGIYQFFSFFHAFYRKSQKTYYIVSSFFFFLLYILSVFFFFWMFHFFFQFFTSCRIETALLTIQAEIRTHSIFWTIFQCFFFPWTIGIFFFFPGPKVCSRRSGWIFVLLVLAWILPPDFLIQSTGILLGICFYECILWIYFFRRP